MLPPICIVLLAGGCQVWENVLNLMDHEVETKTINGKKRQVMVPQRQRFISRNAAAAVFWSVGLTK